MAYIMILHNKKIKQTKKKKLLDYAQLRNQTQVNETQKKQMNTPQTWYFHHMIQKSRTLCHMSLKLMALFLASQIKT